MPNTKVVGIIFSYILTPIPNLYDHSFPRYGQITFLTFRRPTTLTFDLKFWKYLSVTVYPYVICMASFIMIGWEMAEILHFEILRKHGQTNTHTNKHTNRHGHYNTSPSPYGGRGNNSLKQGNQRWQTSPAAPPVCVPNFIMIGWEMAEILHFEILRKHGQRNTHTNKQTDRHGHYNTSPSPYGGRGN